MVDDAFSQTPRPSPSSAAGQPDDAERRTGALRSLTGLGDARALSELIVDTIREGLLVLDLDLRVIAANEPFRRLFGMGAEATVGRSVFDLGDGQWDLPELRRLLQNVLPRAQAFDDFEVDQVVEGVGRRVVLLNARRFEEHQMVLLALEDVTDRRGAERDLQASVDREGFLLELSDALRPLLDPAEVQREAARRVCEWLGAGRAGYAEDAGDGETIVIRSHFVEGALPLEGTFRYEDFGDDLLREIHDGQTVVFGDIPDEPALTASQKAAYGAVHVGAMVDVPLVKDGRLRGVFFVHHPEPRAWSAAEVALVEAVAERTWAAVEQARAEASLRESESRFRTIADHIAQLAWMADGTGAVSWYNRRWYEYTGTTFADVEGLGWHRVHHPDHLGRVVERLARSFETGQAWEDTFPLRGADGTYRWFLSRALPVHDEAGDVVRWFGTNTDVTERLGLERSLRDLNETLERRVDERTEQVRELALALTLAEQTERRRIAHVLHDDLQQRLHGLSFTIELLRRHVGDEGAALCDRAGRALAETAELTRTLSHELSPPLLRGDDLSDLLAWIVNQKREVYGLEVQVEVVGEVSVPDEAVRVLLYQLLRELLFNVIKHAGVTSARVAVERVGAEGRAGGEWIRLVVSDDGDGFLDGHAEADAGHGLASARERVELVGGRFAVASTPGEGTRVTVEVPAAPPGDG